MLDKHTLQTKVQVFQKGILMPYEYTVTLGYIGAKGNKTTLSIGKGCGCYNYYLEALMGISQFSNPLDDKLTLDSGHKLSVTGMLKVYEEIINLVVLKGISV